MGYFDHCPNRWNSHSFKYSKEIMKKRMGRDDLDPLWVADMDFRSPPPVVDALMDLAAQGIYGYSTSADDNELFQSVAQWEKNIGWDCQAQWIAYSPGVVNSMYYLLKVLCKPGDKVIVQNPVYGPFRSVIQDVGASMLNNPLSKEESDSSPYYKMDYKDLEEKAADPEAKALLLCSPSNPGGRVWKKEELEKVRDICLNHGVFVISDEIHGDLIYPGETHIPWGCIASGHQWAVLVSPSKTFNVPGLGTSFAIIPDASLKKRFEICKYRNHGAMENPFGLAAAKAAYTQGRPWLLELRQYLLDNYKLIQESLPNSMKLFRQEGTYLAWLDCHELGNQKELEDFFYEKRKLGLQMGKDFGPGGEGFARLNFAVSRKRLKEVLREIAREV